MWRLLLLYVAAVSAAAPPPSPPPYNTPPGEAPVVLSSEGLGMSTDALGQGISNFNFSSMGVNNGVVCVCALSRASHALLRAQNCEKTLALLSCRLSCRPHSPRATHQVFDTEFRTCNVCYTQFSNKQVSSPTYIPATSWCSAYRNSACCNADTVAEYVGGQKRRESISLGGCS